MIGATVTTEMPEERQVNIYPFREHRRVYCAGPLFNEPERQEMTAIADALRRVGFETFLPHEAGFEFTQVQSHLGSDPDLATRLLNKAIFAVDVYQVVLGCGSLVLNMNGRVPDEGAVAEAAMAWMLGKPLVIYKNDDRTSVANDDNPLVVGMGKFNTINKIDDIGPALLKRWFVWPDRETPVTCPSNLQDTLTSGKRLWAALEAMGSTRPAAQVAQIIRWEFRQEFA